MTAMGHPCYWWIKALTEAWQKNVFKNALIQLATYQFCHRMQKTAECGEPILENMSQHFALALDGCLSSHSFVRKHHWTDWTQGPRLYNPLNPWTPLNWTINKVRTRSRLSSKQQKNKQTRFHVCFSSSEFSSFVFSSAFFRLDTSSRMFVRILVRHWN